MTDESARRPPQGAVLRRVYTVTTYLPSAARSYRRQKVWVTLVSVVGMAVAAFALIPDDAQTGVAAAPPAHVSSASPA